MMGFIRLEFTGLVRSMGFVEVLGALNLKPETLNPKPLTLNTSLFNPPVKP